MDEKLVNANVVKAWRAWKPSADGKQEPSELRSDFDLSLRLLEHCAQRLGGYVLVEVRGSRLRYAAITNVGVKVPWWKSVVWAKQIRRDAKRTKFARHSLHEAVLGVISDAVEYAPERFDVE